MSFDPRNILVIDFGQLGDVVLSLPALAALRQKFPRARVTVAVGGGGHGFAADYGCGSSSSSVFSATFLTVTFKLG